MIWPELMVVQWGFRCDGVVARWLLLAYLLCTLCTLAMVLRARTIAQRLAPFALQSLARCAILPWKGGDLAFAEANQLLSLDEVPQK